MISGTLGGRRITAPAPSGEGRLFFAHPDLLDFLDAEPKLEYVVAMACNAVLERKAEQAMQFARSIAAVTGGTAHVYHDADSAAGSWFGPEKSAFSTLAITPGSRKNHFFPSAMRC